MNCACKNAESTEEKHRNCVEHFAVISFGDWGENDAAEGLAIEVSVESYEKACIKRCDATYIETNAKIEKTRPMPYSG